MHYLAVWMTHLQGEDHQLLLAHLGAGSCVGWHWQVQERTQLISGVTNLLAPPREGLALVLGIESTVLVDLV